MYQECFVPIWLIKVRSKLCRLIIKIQVSEDSEEKETRFYFFIFILRKIQTADTCHIYIQTSFGTAECCQVRSDVGAGHRQVD